MVLADLFHRTRAKSKIPCLHVVHLRTIACIILDSTSVNKFIMIDEKNIVNNV